ncbi:MAG: hypothetical protein DMF84_22085 [Acidobacteria bacterium]|nr:MAG: hypothetical protein DMF84_22085 [Acidobacteriota bacterium]
MRFPKDLIETADAARILGVTPDAVRQMARRGDLRVQFTSPRGWRLYHRAVVERLAAVRRRFADDAA